MKQLFQVLLLISIVFTASAAGIITPNNKSSVIAIEKPVKPVGKSRFELSKKDFKKLSIPDMETILGREMTDVEKTAFKTDKKKFVKATNMVEVKRTNTMAIIGFVTSLILPPLGIIFGIIALTQIKKSGEAGRGWAIAGIVVGAVLTAWILLWTAAWGGFA